ncbi:MAG: ATP-binding cassette domain-containing protein, partial [Solirubrobacteraceae bacterium]
TGVRVRRAPDAGQTVLRLVARTSDGRPAFGDLTVAAGEIVGVAGVEGNGQRELAERIVGLSLSGDCEVVLDGADVTRLGPRDRAIRWVAYVPEDPASNALVPDFPVAWNLGLRRYRDTRPERRRWAVDMDALRDGATRAIRSFDIRGATEDTRTAILSGGNRQKVVLARELAGTPMLLVIVNPTVGLDIGAAQGVHQALRAHRDRGAAIVMISTDLDEIEALSDRIAVLYRGAIVETLPRATADRRRLGLLMTGIAAPATVGQRHDASDIR